MVDFYFKNQEDISYKTGIFEETSEVQQLLGQIKMILFTNRGEVLGDTSLGLNIERLIFETNVNKSVLMNTLNQQINMYLRYDRAKFDVSFNVDFYKGTVRDIAVLEVIINSQKVLDVLLK